MKELGPPTFVGIADQQLRELALIGRAAKEMSLYGGFSDRVADALANEMQHTGVNMMRVVGFDVDSRVLKHGGYRIRETFPKTAKNPEVTDVTDFHGATPILDRMQEFNDRV